MDITHPLISEYIESHCEPEDSVLAQIRRETYVHQIYPRMISGLIQGKFLTLMSSFIVPQRILEIGSFTGYSSICLARGLRQGGKLITIEKNPELEVWIRKNIQLAELEEQIDLRIGDALEIIPTIQESIDLVFIDADKEQYPAYFEMILPLVRKGGCILADNVLWDGKVLDPLENRDKETQGILKFNQLVEKCPEVNHLILPMRDGLSIMMKK